MMIVPKIDLRGIRFFSSSFMRQRFESSHTSRSQVTTSCEEESQITPALLCWVAQNNVGQGIRIAFQRGVQEGEAEMLPRRSHRPATLSDSRIAAKALRPPRDAFATSHTHRMGMCIVADPRVLAITLL
jgi:hypothetical protein